MKYAAEILIAVLNSLWLAVVVAGLVWAALKVLPRFKVSVNAATRYAIWWAALFVVLLLPAAPRLAPRIAELLRPARHSAPAAAGKNTTSPAPAAPSLLDFPVLLTVHEERTARWPVWIAGLWTAVFLFRVAQITRSYFYLRGVKRRAATSVQSLPTTSRPVALLLSDEIASPMAVGFLRPAVILPESLPRELDKNELEHVLLHETAHIARRDDWANLAMRILDGMVALHPVAMWILRQIEREREMACDDWVVAQTGEARPYAASLARMFEMRWSKRKVGPNLNLASGIFGAGGVGDRIEMLLKRGREFSPRTSVARVGASTVGLFALLVMGSLAPRWIAFAQERRLTFDVASIKLRASDSGGMTFAARPGGRLTVQNNELSNVIDNAYRLRRFQLVGGPDWINSDRFDIEAKTDGSSTGEQMMRMLQSLLEDRFKLRVHRETREVPVYVLTVAKGGHKLNLLKSENCVPPDRTNPAPVPANYCGDDLVRQGVWNATNISSGFAAGALAAALGRPVIDKSGITGSFDVHLEWSPDDSDATRPSIFTALQNELGLRLESAKGPVEVLVIDQVEKPDAN